MSFTQEELERYNRNILLNGVYYGKIKIINQKSMY